MSLGRIVVLNGAPRSGKSSIASAVQTLVPGSWVNLGVDAQMRSTPSHLLPGIGLRPRGERPDLESSVQILFAALYDSIAAYSRQGLDVVVDIGHHDGYSQPLGILPDSARRLAGLPAYLVGIRCTIEVIMERRRANPKGYEAGPGVPEPVQRWQDAVHIPGLYDLEIESSRTTPEAAAQLIAKFMAQHPKPVAFPTLAQF
jgi:chloramphenicol 3-O phosphotransferase